MATSRKEYVDKLAARWQVIVEDVFTSWTGPQPHNCGIHVTPIIDRGICIVLTQNGETIVCCNWFVGDSILHLLKIWIPSRERGIGAGSLLYDIVLELARSLVMSAVVQTPSGYCRFTEHENKTRAAYLIRRGWSFMDEQMIKRVDSGCRSLFVTGSILYGIETRASGVGGGWRRMKTVLANDPVHAVAKLFETKFGVKQMCTRDDPFLSNASEICAVPFAVWIAESRAITGDPEMVPIEDYTTTYGRSS